MGSRQLVVFGVVLACISFSDAKALSVSQQNYWGVDGPAAAPEREPSRESTQQVNVLQAQRIQPAVNPLSWTFPEDPVDSVKETPVNYVVRQPATANRVAVRCGESRIQVEVSQDLLGLGKLINPGDITLGGCAATEIDDVSHVLAFEYELHRCGSRRVLMENILIYAFTLIYNPDVSGRGSITRSQGAVIGVECHYLV
ncbi:zona pellucida sperm-binding protein 3-like [Cebidichthys violaceus]|uniref:zona pellucida sperm-binding protein 3-like n=1 Tax=Cebidichthys violaceus TaxID=271503 RepID=UPI0035CAB6B2